MADIFVSYSSTDRERVRPIVEALETAGWSVWWDRKIEAGRAFDREIEKEIDSAKSVVVVWSEASIDSDWVRNEASEGLDRGILVPVALDDVRPPLAFRRQQTISLIGKADFEEVIAAVARYVRKKQASDVQVLPCIGRDRESGDLRRVLETVKGGIGGTVLIGGEPGIGKTRLLKEAARDARAMGFAVLVGNCRKEMSLPYEPWVEQLETILRLAPPEQIERDFAEHAAELALLIPKLHDLLEEIPEKVSLPPEQERRLLMNGLTDFVQKQAHKQPSVLIFEDLQWADESTCALLHHLAARLEDSPVLLLGTFRDNELAASSPAGMLFQNLLRERIAEEVVLKRFRRKEVAQFLEQLSGRKPPEELIDLVFSETEGNPFFVEEVYRHLADLGKLFDDDGNFKSGIEISETEVPRSVLLVIQNRLERVSENCRNALTMAATIGRAFQFRTLSAASDLPVDDLLTALEEADAATLIEELSSDREANYRFVHEQIRQTLLHDISFPRRQRMHIKIAKALQESDGRNAEIAHHLYTAGDAADSKEALEYLEKAIDEGLEAVAFEDVLPLLNQASELADNDEAIAAIASRRARALQGSSSVEAAATALDEAISRIRSSGIAQDLLLQKIELLVAAYKSKDAIGDIKRILDRAKRDDNKELQMRAQFLLARGTYQQSLDEPGAAEEWRKVNLEAIALARELGNKKALARALIDNSHLVDYWPDQYEEARASVLEAIEIARDLDDERIEIEAHTLGLQVNIFKPKDVEIETEAVRKRLVEMRDPLMLKEFLFWMMWQTFSRGNTKRCVEVCSEGIEIAEKLGLPPVQYPTIKGLALTDLGRIDQAEESIQNEVSHGDYRFGRAFQEFGHVNVHFALNDIETTLKKINDLIPEIVILKRNWILASLIGTLSRAAFDYPDDLKEKCLSTIENLRNAMSDDSGGYHINPVFQALLEEGPTESSLDQLRKQIEKTNESGYRREWMIMDDAYFRVLRMAGNWQAIIDHDQAALGFAQRADLKRFAWLFFAYRAEAFDKLGQSERAKSEASKSFEILEAILSSTPSVTLQECLRAHPMAEIVERLTA